MNGGAQFEEMVPEWASLEVVRELTNLQQYDVMDVFDMFASHADSDGLLSREAFYACFQQLVTANGDPTHEKMNMLNATKEIFYVEDLD